MQEAVQKYLTTACSLRDYPPDCTGWQSISAMVEFIDTTDELETPEEVMLLSYMFGHDRDFRRAIFPATREKALQLITAALKKYGTH